MGGGLPILILQHGFVGLGGRWELGEEERVQRTCASPAGLLLGSSNSRPSHWPLSFPLDPPPIIIHLAYIHVLWTLSSFPNSHHPPNLTNPGGGLKFVDLRPFWLVGLTFRKIRSLLCLRSQNKKKKILIWVHGLNFEKKWKNNFEIFYQLRYVPKWMLKL